MRWAYLVDAVLGVVGLAIVFAAFHSSKALVVALPVVALLAVLVRERGGRLDDELELRDATRSDRAYRTALSTKAALEELRRNRGTQFDPDVVDVLIRTIDRG